MTKCLYCCVVQAAFPEDGKCPNCGAPMQWSQRETPTYQYVSRHPYVGTALAYSHACYTLGMVNTARIAGMDWRQYRDEHNAAMSAADEARGRKS